MIGHLLLRVLRYCGASRVGNGAGIDCRYTFPFPHFCAFAGTDPQGKFDEADRLLVRAIRMLEKALGVDHMDVATNLNKRANVLHVQVNVSFVCSRRREPVNLFRPSRAGSVKCSISSPHCGDRPQLQCEV